ncbi:hypothetical protein fugu_017274 [Takifugu bimaculatus]|uniref:Cell growth regulator with RING finger domain protein 1 n=1 Tax=Takifugu bimaculatus TaxID=433685 RepID=A0A4Z2BQI7_9TELE|nr:hypothetical protein fugu_017274 [Takifugu bimaculatus]
MAAVFLVTLFEYSPLFYITLVSLCFIVTAAIVVGWCGFDVPVILRSSEETESILPPPEKQMVQVTNPFGLELTSGPASVTAGVSLRAVCLSPSVLSCFWGCEIRALQRGLQAHQSGTRLTTCHQFQEVLHSASLHFQRFNEDAQECLTQIPACQGVTDFGPLPRARYPLVAVLTLAEPAGRHIAASINIIHVPDSKYSSAARIIFQYLLTSQGNIYELKSLFMSADGGQVGQAPSRDQSLRDGQPSEEATTPAPGTRQEVEVEGCRDCCGVPECSRQHRAAALSTRLCVRQLCSPLPALPDLQGLRPGVLHANWEPATQVGSHQVVLKGRRLFRRLDMCPGLKQEVLCLHPPHNNHMVERRS